jgi:CheY-like chemotaxis protein
VSERRSRILVIDDDLSFCELLREVLTSEGYDVECVGKPPPLTEVAGYDVVIIDVFFARVPVGLALVRDLLASSPRPKIVVCSADGGLLKQRSAELQDPNVRVLAKPFEIDELLAAIGDLTST